ncbi:hypothetical protein B0H16DRAFT_1695014 [Mycena metata]|uniref:NADH:flavin oxidoreductase/NADH oxidase N-terminal domain-containing protein n=1 Tax=Mycena metata TaxID=1033252 RepID=A0AAD7MZL3_9AGAR|nr:hypothetical protein B0H16DRAFT_1695014 [Mycena metata]
MEQVPGWRKITNVVHLAGSKMYCQLWHAGRLTSGKPGGPQPNYEPSAIPARGRSLCFNFLPSTSEFGTRKEILDPSAIVTQFKHAAKNANTRSGRFSDKWGGSSENRARFGLEVLKSLVEVFGSNVSLKISPGGGFHDMGMPLQETIDTFSYFISEADKLRLSYITLFRYIPRLDPIIDESRKERGTSHELLSTYAKLTTNAKIFIVGGVTPEEAEMLVRTNQVHGVFFETSWLTHPDLAKRIRHGKSINNMLAVPHLYGDVDVDPRIGYTDYSAVTY